MFAVMIIQFLVTCLSAEPMISPATPLDAAVMHDHIVGSLLGSALADALGRATEPLATGSEIKRVYGQSGITSVQQMSSCDWIYEPYKNKQAPYTSNTVLARLTFDACIEGRKNDDTDEQITETIAQKIIDLFGPYKYARDNHFGFRRHSDYCMKIAEHLSHCRIFNRTPLWWIIEKDNKNVCQPLAENESGALARAWPIGLIFADKRERILSLARSQTLVTHGHPSVIAASAALAIGISYALQGESADRIVAEMALVAEHYQNSEQAYKPRAKKVSEAELATLLRLEKNHYYTSDMITYYACQARTHRDISQFLAVNSQELGVAADEMIALVAYIIVKYDDNPRQAMTAAANLGGRTSLLAALVGAFMGARHGFALLKGPYAVDIDMLENNQSFHRAADELSMVYGKQKEHTWLSHRFLLGSLAAVLLGIGVYTYHAISQGTL